MLTKKFSFTVYIDGEIGNGIICFPVCRILSFPFLSAEQFLQMEKRLQWKNVTFRKLRAEVLIRQGEKSPKVKEKALSTQYTLT